MGHLLPPPPSDDLWDRAALPLHDLMVLLRLDPAFARRWVRGTSRTVLGTRLQVREPVARAIGGTGLTTHVPLDGIAVVVMMDALSSTGAAEETLAHVVARLHHRYGGPVLAHRIVRDVLPAALLEASQAWDAPSLRRPLRLTDEGWVGGAALDRAAERVRHDEDGWVTGVVLADIDGLRVLATTEGLRAEGETADDPAVHLFRQGWSLDAVATATATTVEHLEDVLRQRISP